MSARNDLTLISAIQNVVDLLVCESLTRLIASDSEAAKFIAGRIASVQEESLLTRKEAAKALGKGRSTVSEMAKDGRLDFVEVGGRKMYRPSDIRRLQREGET